MTKHNQNYIIENCILDGQLTNSNRISNNRKFNFTDFYYILHRSMKNSIIREWRWQLLKCFSLFIIAFYYIFLYPNDIGLDPSCAIDINDDSNVTQITEKIYDIINGNRAKAELNVNYLACLFLSLGYVCSISFTFVFLDEIKVSQHYNMFIINIIFFFRYS